MGVDFSDPEGYIVSLGWADSMGNFAIDWRSLCSASKSYLYDRMSERRLTAFNVMFDGGWLFREFDEWFDWEMCTYGMYRQLSREGHPGQSWKLADAQRDVLGWGHKDVIPDLLKKHGFNRAEMGKLIDLEPDEFLKYNAWDAEAHWQLYEEFVKVCNGLGKYGKILAKYHMEDFMTSVFCLVEQQMRGLGIDRPKLEDYATQLDRLIDETYNKFLSDPGVYEAHEKMREAVLIQHKEPEKKTTVSGAPTKAYLKWQVEHEALKEVSIFNPRSDRQMRWLFYEQLGNEVKKYTKSKDNPQPSVDKEALLFFGQPGKDLLQTKKYQHELGTFVQGCLKKARGGVLHPELKSQGTITGRLASGIEGEGASKKFNLLNQVKTPGYLECYVPRKDHVLVHLDFASLEPCVMAYLSRDDTYMKLYGPGAKPHDVYLYVGCTLSMFRDKFLEFYDMENPTVEGIKACKNKYKKDRYACKKFHLSGMYKAFPKTKWINLLMADYQCEFEEIKQAHEEYWDTFVGVLDYEKRLLLEWRKKGYFIGATGLPITLSDFKEKDILNQQCQTSGHAILHRYIYWICQFKRESKTPMYPWIVDYHDESIWEVPKSAAEEACDIKRRALERVNEELDWDVMIKGDPDIAYNLAMIKCEDYVFRGTAEDGE
jgi:hypothetical protein